ncbi:MAG: response regulator transcription factor [Spirochaetales bacterium]|nr:response regulator transcription factor [Spirochaetales bacterium]
MEHIMVLEDSESILQSVENYLRLNDYEVTACSSCRDAEEKLDQLKPDLAIIDVSLPDGNGFFFAREHLVSRSIPFVFLTSQNQESDRITGFELGALDYVVKPFSLKELILRIKAILKRAADHPDISDHTNQWKLNDDILQYDSRIHRITINASDIHLTTTEWDILSALIQHDGAILSREQIQSNIHLLSTELSPRTIDSHIKNLRNKLGNPEWVKAVRGFGFRFTGEACLA